MNIQNDLSNTLSNIWNDYALLNPPAKKIHSLLSNAGEKIVNDHIAFRTISHPNIDINVMAEKFIQFGYNIEKRYNFTEKKLNALHLEHFDLSQPKIFISEIDLNQLSTATREIFNKMFSDELLSSTESFKLRADLPYSGRHWNPSYQNYTKIYAESPYAAWVYAHGFRANHFTVFVNKLRHLNDIAMLNSYLKMNNFKLNTSGGEIKGNASVFLEQSSTIAEPVLVNFKDGLFSVPGGYYEFAKRYPQENNKLFQGFIAESANKIFESTNQQNQSA